MVKESSSSQESGRSRGSDTPSESKSGGRCGRSGREMEVKTLMKRMKARQEHNREAAKRLRDKKKEDAILLKNRMDMLQKRNQELRAEITNTVHSIQIMRTGLMAHRRACRFRLRVVWVGNSGQRCHPPGAPAAPTPSK